MAPASSQSPLRSPPSSKTARNTVGLIAKGVPPLPLSRDPAALLDSLDHRQQSARRSRTSSESKEQQQQDDGFDPIDFLNQHYETEQSLSQQLPALRESVSTRMDLLNDRISHALQRQSETADSTRRHVTSAKASCLELQSRILQIQQKAAASEKAVLEITADMKRLDCAKRHLSRTITTLKRLHMLVHAVEQLRITTMMSTPSGNKEERGFPDYKTASHLVDAVSQLFQHFDAYTGKVQPMRILSAKVADYKEALRQSVTTGFRVVAFGPERARQLQQQQDSSEADDDEGAASSMIMSVEVMKGGVLLIESLDEQQRFIHEFCQDQLGDYLKEFEPPNRQTVVKQQPEKRVSSFKKVVEPEKPEPTKVAPKAGLDQIEQRYTWFLNGPLKSIQEKFPGVFPSRWNLQASLAGMFLQLTRDHILALLDGPRKDPAAGDAAILLKALKKTIVFEVDITGWLERECGAVFETTDDDASASASISRKVPVEEGTPILKPLVGVASVAFQAYMAPYIRLEEQTMDEQLVEALEDRTVDTRGERPVFISSTNLFVYIKGSITRCTALTKGNAFYLLYCAFKGSLKEYAQILNSKLPSPLPAVQGPNVGGIVIAPFGGGGNKQENAATGTNASYRIPVGEEVTVCHVISTCEYCADTMEALEDLIRDTIEEEYKNKIDMISDQEQFHDTTAKSIRVLVSGLTNRLEGPLKTMASTNWGGFDTVGDESLYVHSIHEEVEPFVRTIRSLLPTSYFRSFCDKFAMAFSATFYDNLVRVKRISAPGTQQLLLDLANLKTLFLKLPVLEDVAVPGKKAPGASIAPAMYTKTVQKQFGRMETILKLVGTPNDLLIDNFKVQWPAGTTSDMQIVMTLKGMKRNEQVAMLEKFGYDPVSALKGATAGVTSAAIVSERVQQLQDQGSNVAAQFNSDLNQMRQKVDVFRKTFR